MHNVTFSCNQFHSPYFLPLIVFVNGFCRCLASDGYEISLQERNLFAKKQEVVLGCSCKSFMYKMNNSGPRTVPLLNTRYNERFI